MHSDRLRQRPHGPSALFTSLPALTLALCLAAGAFFALPAHATYADVADSYGTIEALDAKTDFISADDIPDGTYSGINVRTSSSFCKVSSCTLKKSGDSLVAAFTLSRSYTAVYVGTADEAAAQTSADGTDSSAYTMAKEVSVGGSTQHQFTIALSGVNESMSIATFNGGSQGLNKGCWYDRMFIFDASNKLILAVQSGVAPSDDDEGEPAEGADGKDEKNPSEAESGAEKGDGQEPEPAAQSADAGGSSAGASAGAGNGASSAKGSTKAAAEDADDDDEPAEAGEAEEPDDDDADADDADADEEKPAATAAAGKGDTSKPGHSSSAANSTAQDEPAAEDDDSDGDASEDVGTDAASQAQHRTIPGTPLSFVSAELVPDELDAAAPEAAQDGTAQGTDPTLPLVAASALALAAAGFVLRALLFKRAGGTFGRT